ALQRLLAADDRQLAGDAAGEAGDIGASAGREPGSAADKGRDCHGSSGRPDRNAGEPETGEGGNERQRGDEQRDGEAKRDGSLTVEPGDAEAANAEAQRYSGSERNRPADVGTSEDLDQWPGSGCNR